ncbi:MAG: ATP-dependent DNA ligase, partial [Saprospiraceae bacterium]
MKFEDRMMEQFSNLFLSLDHTNKTNAKVEALASYFATAPEKDRLWAIALLSHRRPKRTVSTTLLRKWASETANLPLWFFEETYHIVGDLAEAIALVLPPSELLKHRTLSEWIDVVRSWATLEEDQKRQAVTEAWMQLDSPGRFVFNKLITGGFRMGVSQKLMTRALSKATGIDENILAHRLMGNWSPEDTTFESLVLTDHPSEDASRPYPFFLAHPLEAGPESLGHPSEWLIEHKWDGIRGQIIIRANQLFIWSRGEELMT